MNIALGNVSVTVAITSIASSFDKLYPASAGRLLATGFVMAISGLLVLSSLDPGCRSLMAAPTLKLKGSRSSNPENANAEDFYSVKIVAPVAVTATVCSK